MRRTVCHQHECRHSRQCKGLPLPNAFLHLLIEACALLVILVIKTCVLIRVVVSLTVTGITPTSKPLHEAPHSLAVSGVHGCTPVSTMLAHLAHRRWSSQLQ